MAIRLIIFALTLGYQTSASAVGPLRSMYPKYILDDTSEHAITPMPDPSIPVIPVLSTPYRRAEVDTTSRDYSQFVIGSLYDPANQGNIFTFLDSSIVKVTVAGEQIWRLDNDRKIFRASSFDVSSRGNIVMVGHLKGQLLLLDSNTGAVSRQIDDACDGPCTATAIAPDESFVAVGSASGHISVLNTTTGVALASWQALSWPVRNIRIFSSPSGNFIVAHDWSTVTIFNIDEGREVKRLTHLNRDGLNDIWIDTLSMLSGESRALVCSDRILKILDLRDGSIVREFSGSNDVLLAGQVDPDETKIVAFARDHTVMMWDIDDGALVSKHRIDAGSLSTFVNVSIAPTSDKLSLTSLELVFTFPPALINTVKTYSIPQN